MTNFFKQRCISGLILSVFTASSAWAVAPRLVIPKDFNLNPLVESFQPESNSCFQDSIFQIAGSANAPQTLVTAHVVSGIAAGNYPIQLEFDDAGRPVSIVLQDSPSNNNPDRFPINQLAVGASMYGATFSGSTSGRQGKFQIKAADGSVCSLNLAQSGNGKWSATTNAGAPISQIGATVSINLFAGSGKLTSVSGCQ